MSSLQNDQGDCSKDPNLRLLKLAHLGTIILATAFAGNESSVPEHGKLKKIVSNIVKHATCYHRVAFVIFSPTCCFGFIIFLWTFGNFDINSLRHERIGRTFADGILNCIFFKGNVYILIQISLKFFSKCNWQYIIISSGNGSALSRRQAITYTMMSNFTDTWCHMATMS